MPRIAVDNRGVIQAWNHAAQELLGYSRRQTLGRSVTVLLADGEASTAGDGSPAGQACVDRHGEVTLRHRDGQLVSCCLQQFAALAGEFGVLLSVGRTGQCWDNALAESFFSTIKRELLGTAAWPSRAASHTAIFDFIEGSPARTASDASESTAWSASCAAGVPGSHGRRPRRSSRPRAKS
ncbi:PAS domain-containing protein [Streptomyces sp. NBC_00353]